MERLTRLGTVIAAFFACFLAAGTGVAATGEQLCRQLEAELAAASSVGDAPPYGEYDKAMAIQHSELRKAHQQARDAGCGSSRSKSGRGRCGSLNVMIQRMERNLEALWSKRTELAETSNAPTVRARLLASLEGNGCRDGTEPPLQVLPPMEDAGLNPSPLEQMLDDGTEQQDIPEEHILRDPRRVTVPGRSKEPGTSGGDQEPSARPYPGSITTLGAASTSAPTKLPPPGERKVRVVGPVFLPDREGAIDPRAPGPKKAR